MKTTSLTSKLRLLAISAVITGGASGLHAQWVISNTDTANVITFDSTISGVYTTATGSTSGWNTTPSSSSPFDTDAWAARVGSGASTVLPTDATSSTTSVGFGAASQTTGSVARGTNSTAGFTAGVGIATSLNDVTNNRGLAFNPQGTGTDNATVWLKVQNNTGATVTQWTIDYTGYYINIGSYATPVSFAYSSDGSSFSSNVSALGFTTPGTGTVTSATTADWTSVSITATTIDATVANGGYLYLRWQLGQDITTNSAYGNRIALDDISVTAVSGVPEPSTFAALAGLGVLGFVASRRRR